jgi:hypothetical protein
MKKILLVTLLVSLLLADLCGRSASRAGQLARLADLEDCDRACGCKLAKKYLASASGVRLDCN